VDVDVEVDVDLSGGGLELLLLLLRCQRNGIYRVGGIEFHIEMISIEYG
jgi:hypothetical protein